jgi:putative two-component system response regulator
MDGFEAITVLKSEEKLKDIPVIFLTAMQDSESEIKGFDLGALDFIIKPFSAPVLVKRIETHIETDKLIKKSQQAVRDIHNTTIRVIADVVESRDKVTGKHIERTQKFLAILIKELIRTGVYTDEISKWNIELLLPSSQLHDVGKIIVSDTILNKPGKLTYEEFEIIKQHCAEGERIINEIIKESEGDVFLRHALKFAGYHHEKWDGTGYPRKLCGENIPLEGRLLAIVDVYDALISVRPYKKAFSHEEALEIIKNQSGTHFDPKITKAFINISNFYARELTP